MISFATGKFTEVFDYNFGNRLVPLVGLGDGFLLLLLGREADIHGDSCAWHV